MAKPAIVFVNELIYYSYANLALAHFAVEKNQSKCETLNYVIRDKLFKGLKDGSMNMRSIFDDEQMKLQSAQICNYCGSIEYLSLDHVLPKALGGFDSADNLLFVCKTSNGLLELKIEDLKGMNLPFKTEFMLLTYPNPDQLC